MRTTWMTSHRQLTRRVRTRLAAAALAAALLSQAGCGTGGEGDEPRADGGPPASQSDSPDPGPDLDEGYDELGVPEECRDVFPLAFGGDPDNVTLRPDDWPEPFADAVSCNVSATAGSQQNVSYAVDASRAEVLDAFEAALAELPGYEFAREESAERGYELITGVAGGVGFQIDTEAEGGYTLTFGA